MRRRFGVEDFSVGMPNHEEDVKRLEQDRSDTEKNRKPKCLMCGASGTLANRSLGPRYGARAYTWPPFWRKPGTLTLPTQLGSVFGPTEDANMRPMRA